MEKICIIFLCLSIAWPNTVFAVEKEVVENDVVTPEVSEDVTEEEEVLVPDEDIVPDTTEKESDEEELADTPLDESGTEYSILIEVEEGPRLDSDTHIDPIEKDVKETEEGDNAPEAEETTVTKDSPQEKTIPTHDLKDSDNPSEKISKKPATVDVDIHINEILPNPDGTDSGNEFIELYNNGDNDVSLKDWQLYDKTGKDSSSKRYIFDDVVLESHEYIVLYNKTDFSFALNNSDEELYLADADDTIVSQFSYATSSSGLSWNYDDTWYEEMPTPGEENKENPLTKEYPHIRINEILPNPSGDESMGEFIELFNPFDEDVSLHNWVIRDGSKTGHHVIDDVVIPAKSYHILYRTEYSFALNNSGDEAVVLIAPNDTTISTLSYTATQEDRSLNHAETWYWATPTPGAKNAENPLTKNYPPLLLTEILPNPAGTENTDEYIEIYNSNNTPVNLEGWTLKDATASGMFTFTQTEEIAPRSYYIIYRSTFGFALNNSNETVSLIAPNTKITSTTSYKSSREGVSYNYDMDKKHWRWSKHRTPKKKNIFNNLPIITDFDIDQRAYKKVYAEFSAHATDADREKLKVRWDFGDGRRSYKWETRHKYMETGTYHGTLRIQDESEEIVRTFTVTVKKYPKHKIVITQIVPNPAGKDSGNEYLVIKNKSKKKINLKNWSIATGTKEKTIVNHPIYDDLKIKPGKTKMITKKYAAISLPNKTGVIEIRRPNGTVADDIKYGDKDVSIPDNAVYEEIDDVWQWTIPVDAEELAEINAIIAHAIYNESLFSQQLIEQKIAFSAIHDAHAEKLEKSSTSKSHMSFSFFEKLNYFLNSFVTRVVKKTHDFTHKENVIAASQPYTIPQNTDPCTAPHLPTASNYQLCK